MQCSRPGRALPRAAAVAAQSSAVPKALRHSWIFLAQVLWHWYIKKLERETYLYDRLQAALVLEILS